MSRAHLPTRVSLVVSLTLAFGAVGVATNAARAAAAGCDTPNAVTGPILAYHNSTRTTYKVPKLAWNGQLACLAAGWSKQMAASGTLAHRNLSFQIQQPGYRGKYRALGENILKGPRSMSARSMHNAWMASPSHKKNILSRSYTSAGIGVAFDTKGQVWATANFAG